MKAAPECYACTLERVKRVAAASTADAAKQELCVAAAERLLAECAAACPSYMGTLENDALAAITGNADPYAKQKRALIRKALALYPEAERFVRSGDAFRNAALVAICGNALEFSNPQCDFGSVGKALAGSRQGLAIDDTATLEEMVQNAGTVLYICDNAAEAVFDRLLMKEISKSAALSIAVASRPMRDDASLAEAKKIGLDKLGTIISKGNCFGVWPERCTREFLAAFETADVIVAKGMSCYETLTEMPGAIRNRAGMLFKAKCAPVARSAGVERGSNVCKVA
jgi:uncharacterized protein with ATP-grasp and redox domains